MKRRLLIVYPLLLLCTGVIYFACTKTGQDPSDAEKVKLDGRHKLAVLPPSDTITDAEVTTFFNSVVSAGGLDSLSTDFVTIRPRLYAADFFWKDVGASAKYVPLAFNQDDGRYLKMVVVKDFNFVRGVLVEYTPTAAWRFTGHGYNEMTGVIRFYDVNGELIKGGNMTLGQVTSTFDGTGGWQETAVAAKFDFNCPDEQDPDGDDDLDYIRNCDDECPDTPAGVWVDADGCPLTMELDVFEVAFESNGPESFFYFPTLFEITNPGGLGFPDFGYPETFGAAFGEVMGGTSGQSLSNGYGSLCGHYYSIKTGTARTAQVTNMGTLFYNEHNPADYMNAVIPVMCISVANVPSDLTGDVEASKYIVDAFNWACYQVTDRLNSGYDYNVHQATAALINLFRENLQEARPGSTVSTGNCLTPPNVPVTAAKFRNWTTGNCE